MTRNWLPLVIPALALAALAAGSAGFAQAPPGHRWTTFFMGRIKYSHNNGNDCAGVGRNMAQLMARVSTIAVEDERRMALTDPELFETPFVFMNGHDDFVFSDEELASLRVYLDHGGFLFVSGCCTNPAFPAAWRREIARLFPGESPRTLSYDHPIYRSFYRIDRVRSLHENREVRLEALYYRDRIVSVMGEEGLCCAFSMDNSCNVARGVRPEDGKQLAINLAVYAMTH